MGRFKLLYVHGDMEIDNNLVENAAMYSFMASCKRNGVDEREWLSDIFDRVQGIMHKEIFKLLPSNWAKYRGQL
ncbi:transposase IS66 [Nitritalea halalkaliphila LW7]|uniref:Transposase IS66 n=2 Tax=Nitritalea halalkaliphila LW7 TaxID=1189621 RepID=I5BRH8_9BACT|nr:transposase IS66 [Nitritalea halalkaliphila LW7]